MKNYKVEMKWALTFAAMTLLWAVIEKTAGFHDELMSQQSVFGAFILIPAVIIYLLALKDKRSKFYDGLMSYKQGLLSGLILSIMIGIISMLTSIIILTIISPDYFSNAIRYSVSNSIMTQSQAESQYNISGYIITGAIAAVITGIVITAILMLFLKRTRLDAPKMAQVI